MDGGGEWGGVAFDPGAGLLYVNANEMAWRIKLTERKLPMWNLQQLRSCGVEPSEQRIIVCKGAIAHRAAYAPIAERMIEVETPGSCSGDVRRFPYQNIRRPLFPIDRW